MKSWDNTNENFFIDNIYKTSMERLFPFFLSTRSQLFADHTILYCF